MRKYTGSCHCDTVRFEIIKPSPIGRLTDCNCSICTKKGILHCPTEDEELTLLAGADALVLYQFGSGLAEHRFCCRCGIHVLGRPRSHPERHTVNARCLDDFEAIAATAQILPFDGRHHPKDRG